MPKPAFEHRFRVSLHDTDAAGVLFFAHLFRHAHDAYEAWMAELGFALDDLIRDAELALPLVHAEADYRRPLCHGDRVCIELRLADLHPSSFKIRYLFSVGDGRAVARAHTVHACMDPTTQASRAFPEDLASALRAVAPQPLYLPRDAAAAMD